MARLEMVPGWYACLDEVGRVVDVKPTLEAAEAWRDKAKTKRHIGRIGSDGAVWYPKEVKSGRHRFEGVWEQPYGAEAKMDEALVKAMLAIAAM